ncbi:hypothetical protein [Microbacterium oleivorans]|uniref:hypothetical protein n=1 Tax=Microbacterium TaxID=33882 RepID=UPI0034502339
MTLSVLSAGLAGCTSAAPPDNDAAEEAPSFEAEAAALAESLGIESPPDVKQVRAISLAEWGPTMIQCLKDSGWNATATDDGQGIVYPTVTEPGRTESLNIAIYTCEVQYPVERKYVTPLSDAQLEKLYVYRSTDLIDCLEAEGYDIEADVPSMSVFIESEGAWSPYEGITLTPDAVAEINEACPQIPDDIWN